MQCFHYWPAVFLVEAETLFGREALRPRRFVESVNFPQTLQYEPALQWEVRRDFHTVAAGLCPTKRANAFPIPGQIARKRVAHLDWRGQAPRPLLQHGGPILSRLHAP